jgi:iron complex transport system substrate-binding protein
MRKHKTSSIKINPSKLLLLLFSFILFSNISCRRENSQRRYPGEVEALTRLFTDSSGRQVQLPVEMKKISPSGWLAQVFLSSIAPDLLCSLSVPLTSLEKEFVRAFGNHPITGQFYGQRGFNPEEIARLTPDVIIDIGESKNGITSDMDDISRATGIPVIYIAAGLHDTPQAFRTLGELLAREERAENLALFCEKTLGIAGEIIEKAEASKKTTLFCVGSNGTNVLAKGSFHSEIFDLLAENLAVVNNPSARATGNETNPEQILLWDPQVIIFAPETIWENDPFWKQLRAIREGNYFRVPEGPYNWMGSPPSINRYLGILWLAKQLYPQYAGYDLYAECEQYYRLFYGYNLTRSRFEQLTGMKNENS